MSMFKVLIKTFSTGIATPAMILTRINELFNRDVNSDHFVTVFFGIFNHKTRVLTYSNAGHTPILLLADNQDTQHLESTSIFVGAIDEMDARDSVVALEDPSRLILYTDGVTETMDPEGSQYDLKNFQACCEKNYHRSPEELIQEFLGEVDVHRKGEPFADDLTLLVIDL